MKQNEARSTSSRGIRSSSHAHYMSARAVAWRNAYLQCPRLRQTDSNAGASDSVSRQLEKAVEDRKTSEKCETGSFPDRCSVLFLFAGECPQSGRSDASWAAFPSPLGSALPRTPLLSVRERLFLLPLPGAPPSSLCVLCAPPARLEQAPANNITIDIPHTNGCNTQPI